MACNKQFTDLFTLLDNSKYEIDSPFKKVIKEAVEKAGFCEQQKEMVVEKASKKEGTKKAKGNKGVGAPKKPRKLTGYNLFTRAKMPEVKENKEIEGKQRINEIAKMWKGLEQKDRDEWNGKAKELPTPKAKK